MNRIAWGAVLLIVLGCASAALASEANYDIERAIEYLDAVWASSSLPGGFSVAIAQDGDVILEESYGLADEELGVPISSSTVFDFASVAKQFTGFAVASLVEQGLLSFDDAIHRYMPELPDFGEAITIRHLLGHTSGIRDWISLLKLAGHSTSELIDSDRILSFLTRQQDLNFAPGERFSYCNTGYVLLAEIVARVTGRPFGEWARESIFLPLGMESTHFVDDARMPVAGRAKGYTPMPNGVYANRLNGAAAVGAMSLFSTVDDLAKWTINFRSRAIGSDWLWATMLQSGKLGTGAETGYGLGLHLAQLEEASSFGHPGAWAGIVSDVTYFPERDLGIVFVANRSPSRLDVVGTLASVFLAQGGATLPVPNAAPAGSNQASLDDETIDAYLGWYTVQENLVRIEKPSGRLVAVLPPWETSVRLVPLSDDTFVQEATSDTYSFSEIRDGKAERLRIKQGRESYTLQRVEPSLATMVEVEEYFGEYSSEELSTTYRIEVLGDQLAVSHSFNEPVHLVRIDTDRYLGDRWWMSEVRFLRSVDGQVTGMEIDADQDRVINLRFWKQ